MICQNCGTQNDANSKFCVKCGTPLNTNNVSQNPTMTVQNQQMVNNQNTTNINQTTNQSLKMKFQEYFTTIFKILLKPYTALQDEILKFSSFQNSLILSILISVIAMLVVLLKTIISTVRVTTGGFLTEAKTEWVWDNLKDIDFIKVIGLNFLIFIGIIFAIAVVYYIAGLVVKKQSNFSKLLGLAAVSVVPMLFCALLISPLVTIIYAPLGMGVTIVGAVYTLIILYESINNEFQLSGNLKYYFNLICLSILLIAGYYLYMKFFMVSATEDFSNLFDMLK